jgi:hypothetical protein
MPGGPGGIVRPAPEKYLFRSLRLEGGYSVLARVNVTTGEVWYAAIGGTKDGLLRPRWTRLEDAAPPGLGDYDVILAPVNHPTVRWEVIRVDRASGNAWYYDVSRWAPLPAPAPPDRPKKEHAKPPEKDSKG